MNNVDKLYRKLAKKYNIDTEEIKKLCTYQYKFIFDVMKDSINTKDMLVHHLFKFKRKKRFKDEINKI